MVTKVSLYVRATCSGESCEGSKAMYAIIETGGKQYRVEEGKTLRVEKLPAEKGDLVVFDRVLMVKDGEEARFGQPLLKGCRVKGKVLAQGRARKIIVFKYKPKKNYRVKKGHRQPFSEVLIESIELENKVLES